MTKPEPAADLLQPLADRLGSMPQVRLAVVFGSVARDGQRPGSDVDLGLLLAGGSPALRTHIEAEAGRAAGRTVDVVYLDEAPPLLRFEIARDGVPLVEWEPHLWTDFKAHAMIDWWDWAPTARRIHAALIQRLRERQRTPPTPTAGTG